MTRQRDEVDRKRRDLPRTKVEKNYLFDGADGKETLGDLFGSRTQLIVSHFMFGPGWEEGCVGCSFRSDHVGGALVHLEHHDVSFVTISRAPLLEIQAFQKRMGWRFKWVVVRQRLQPRLSGLILKGRNRDRQGLLQLCRS